MRSGNKSGKFRLIKDVCNCLKTVSWRCVLGHTMYFNGNHSLAQCLNQIQETALRSIKICIECLQALKCVATNGGREAGS